MIYSPRRSSMAKYLMGKVIIIPIFISSIMVASFAYALFCPECGTKNIDEAKYCSNCGKSMPIIENPKSNTTQTSEKVNSRQGEYSSKTSEPQDEINYSKEIKELKEDIKNAGSNGIRILEGIASSWDEARMYRMEYSWLIQLEGEQAARRSSLENTILSIKSKMNKLNNPPTKYEKLYDLLVELFSIYSRIQSILYSGIEGYSRISFGEAIIDVKNNFGSSIDKLEAYLPD
jgi:hypothetical protein